MAMNLQSPRAGRVALIVFLLAVLPTLVLGVRTYRSFELLQSAYAAGAAKTSSIRPWMTLDYLGASFHVGPTALIETLGLPADQDRNVSLKTLADQAHVSPLHYVQRVQRIIAEQSSALGAERDEEGWLGAIRDRILTGLLVYGYPVLAGTLLLGAIGLPLPSGIATTLAGSLAAQGRMSWAVAGAVAVAAAVLGDAVGYGLGRLLGREVLERHGRWIGLTAARRARVQALFDRWGSLTVFVTRTFASYLSSIASLFAGMSRHGLARFIAVAAAGRVVWTAAYLSLGYGIGGDWQAAAGFLANLSGFLALAVVSGASALIAWGRLSDAAPRLESRSA